MSNPKVSACLLNWQRPQNLSRILAEIKQSQYIDEIIVWNNGKKLDLENVYVINSDSNVKCYGRHLATKIAKNDIIYTQDDDVLVPAESIDFLVKQWLVTPDKVHNYLRPSHFQKSGAAQHLLGWGSIFQKDYTVFNKYIKLYGEDALLLRSADNLFGISRGYQTYLHTNLVGMSQSDQYSLHLQQCHLRARKRMYDRYNRLEADLAVLRDIYTDMRYTTDRHDSQKGWQKYFGTFFNQHAILDVGAGGGLSRGRLEQGKNTVVLQDIFPNALVDIKEDTWTINNKSFDVVTIFDVLEHVVDDSLFLDDLVRIARRFVVLTTPNKKLFNCRNKFHFREYTPPELLDLCSKYRIHKLCAAKYTSGTNVVDLTPEEFRETDLPALCVVLDTGL